MKKIVFLLAFILFPIIYSSAQVKVFSKEYEKYMVELETYLLRNKDKEIKKFVFDELHPFWFESGIKNNIKDSMIVISNYLLKKRASPSPYFISYLKLTMYFFTEKKDEANFMKWHNALVYIMNKSKSPLRKFKTLTNFTGNLMKRNALYKTPYQEWAIKRGNYNIVPDAPNSPIRIELRDIDLICKARKDSSTIYKTNGVFYPFSNTFKGEKGKITWERSAFLPEKVFAELSKYQINIKKTGFKADSVYFTHKKYFEEPILGKIEEKILADATSDNAIFPHFTSYNPQPIKNVAPGVNYSGNFTMKGTKFVGSGGGKRSKIIIYKDNGDTALIAEDKVFVFRPGKVSGQSTAFKIPLPEGKEISHPGVILNYIYDDKIKKISVLRDRDEMGKRKFNNTYHNFSMDFQRITWNLNTTKMEFEMISGVKYQASFESNDFYDGRSFDAFKRMDGVNPLFVMRNFSNVYKITDDVLTRLRKIKNLPSVIPMDMENMRDRIYEKTKDLKKDLDKEIGKAYSNAYLKVISDFAKTPRQKYLYRLEKEDLFELKKYLSDSIFETFQYIEGQTFESKEQFLENLVLYMPPELASKNEEVIVEQAKSNAFTALKLAKYMNLQSYQVRHLLLEMAYNGFIEYDINSDEFSINKKLNRYMNYRSKKSDYDVIDIISSKDTTLRSYSVGTFNLNSLNLDIYDINKVQVSAVKNVDIIPGGKRLTLKKNRDFDFDSLLNAGLLQFEGYDFAFKYDDFKFKMDSIDYMRMQVKVFVDSSEIQEYHEKETGAVFGASYQKYFYDNKKIYVDSLEVLKNKDSPEGKREAYHWDAIENKYFKYEKPYKKEDIQTVIENITGELFVDAPSNKSGLADSTRYPIFDCQKEAYVYYDKFQERSAQGGIFIEKELMGGVYDREKFHFKVFPFTVDSINDFTPNSWKAPGFFKSGIFPDFEEDLSIQVDTIEKFGDKSAIFSLGFIREEQDEPYPLYGGKGTAKNKLKLSNKGLHGLGSELNYLTSTVYSDDFEYYPDSMNTMSKEFYTEVQEKDPEYTGTKGLNVFVHWEPYKDSMVISSIEKPLLLYGMGEDYEEDEEDPETILLFGSSIIKPEGHRGFGRMDFFEAELTSNLFQYKHNSFSADTAQLKIKSTTGPMDTAFVSENMNTNFDWSETKIGDFKSNGDNSYTRFPLNQYLCYVDAFQWLLDEEKIAISTSEEALAKDSTASNIYVSTHPNQDSLFFASKTSNFSLKDYLIIAHEVDSIITADASVFPKDSTDIIIRKNANMDKLQEAIILVNNEERFHRLYDASIKIHGRKKYDASANYDYIDEIDSIQTLNFSPIIVREMDDTIRHISYLQTYAVAKIKPKRNFTLSPNFGFEGKAILQGNKKLLTFDGGVKIFHECDTLMKSVPLSFVSEISPDSIYIPVPIDPKSKNKSISNSFFVSDQKTPRIYGAFLSKRERSADVALYPDSGYLCFNKNKGEYRIAAFEKLMNLDGPGNYISLQKEFCTMYGEAKMQLGVNLGQVKLEAAGNIYQDMKLDTTGLDLILGVDFFFADKCIDIMLEKILEDPMLPVVDPGRKTYKKALRELIGEKKHKKFMDDLERLGRVRKFPKELKHTITFSDLKLSWNNESGAYQSVGKIGVGSIGDELINKKLNGYVEIIKKRKSFNGDKINIYLEVSPRVWFFFTYSRLEMFALSSVKEFNEKLTSLKKKDKKMKVEKGPKYTFDILANAKVKKKFIERMQKDDEEDDSDDIEEDEDDENVEEEKKEEEKKEDDTKKDDDNSEDDDSEDEDSEDDE